MSPKKNKILRLDFSGYYIHINLLCLHESRTLLFITKSRKIVFHWSLKNGKWCFSSQWNTMKEDSNANYSTEDIFQQFCMQYTIPENITHSPTATRRHIFSLSLSDYVASTITKCSKIDKKCTFRNASSPPLRKTPNYIISQTRFVRLKVYSEKKFDLNWIKFVWS